MTIDEYYKQQLQNVIARLNDITQHLVEQLNIIYKRDFSNKAAYIGIWIPLGSRYYLRFTYMTHDHNETDTDYTELSTLDDVMEDLIADVESEYDEYDTFTKHVYREIALWLGRGIDCSLFQKSDLPKVMIINNVCAYLNVHTGEVIEESELID